MFQAAENGVSPGEAKVLNADMECSNLQKQFQIVEMSAEGLIQNCETLKVRDVDLAAILLDFRNRSAPPYFKD